jgi:hypothetical protein
MLRRYTHLRPEQLHIIAERLQQSPSAARHNQAFA